MGTGAANCRHYVRGQVSSSEAAEFPVVEIDGEAVRELGQYYDLTVE